MSEQADRLLKYRKGGGGAATPPVAAEGEKKPYEPYRFSKTERRYLEFRRKFPEPVNAVTYGMLTFVDGECRMGLGVTLTYGVNMMVVDIVGENLAELFKNLIEWKVEFIEEFDADWHIAPTDENAPLVKSISINRTRPENPPPVNQRH